MIYSAGLFARKAIVFLLIPIYTRALPPEEYGVLGIVYFIMTFLVSLYMFGLNDSMARYFVLEENKKKIFSTVFNIVLLVGFLFTVIGFCSQTLFSRLLFSSPNYQVIFRLTMVLILAETLHLLPILTLRLDEKAMRLTLTNIARFIINISLNIYLVVYLEWGLAGILYGNIISILLVSLSLTDIFRQYYSVQIAGDRYKPLLKYGLPFLPNALFIGVIMMADRYIIELLKGLEAVGHYTLGDQLGRAISVFVYGFMHAWTALVFKVKKEDHSKAIFDQILQLYARAGIVIWFLLSIYIEEIYQVFVGPGYSAGIALVAPIALAYFLFGIEDNFAAAIYIKGRSALFPIATAVAALLNILLNILIIPKYGIIGAAYTTLLSYIIYTAVVYRLAQRVMRIKYNFKELLLTISPPLVIVIIFKYFGPGLLYKIIVTVLYLSYAYISLRRRYLKDIKKLIW